MVGEDWVAHGDVARHAFVEAAGGEDAEGGCELCGGMKLVLMGLVVGSCGMGGMGGGG